MSLKNAFKNLIAHFGTVWAVLLYITIFGAVLVGLSLPFLLPIAGVFAEAGVFDGISKAFSSLFGDGGWMGFTDGLTAVFGEVQSVFTNNDRVATLTMSFLIFVATVAFRFFFGLYEIPLATVIDGRMSCNASYGFGGKFISMLGTSVKFSLAKMPITIAFDFVTFGTIYGMIALIGMNVVLPFAVILVLMLCRAFRSSMLACWAPCVVEGRGIFKSFGRSCEICFKRFGSIYSTFFVTWLLVMAFGLFLAIFTLGVALIVFVPFVMAAFGNIGTTVMYNKCGKRYYIDGTVFTPPTENAL